MHFNWAFTTASTTTEAPPIVHVLYLIGRIHDLSSGASMETQSELERLEVCEFEELYRILNQIL